MTAPFSAQPHYCARLTGAALLALASCAVQAQTSSKNLTPQAQYQADVAFCKSGQSNQNRATCMQEAGAALEEAKRHRLSNGQTSYSQDRTERCQALPADEREDCQMLMSGQGENTKQGSALSGGVLRKTVITVPATPTTPNTSVTPSVTPGVTNAPIN